MADRVCALHVSRALISYELLVHPALEHAKWLQRRGQPQIANAMFRTLLRFGRAVGDEFYCDSIQGHLGILDDVLR